MAHFRATIQGARGEASRLGHQEITASVNGWDAGVNVYGTKGKAGDVFTVYATGGSNGNGTRKLIAVVRETRDGFKVENDYKA